VATLFGELDAPLAAIESPTVQTVINALLDIGRAEPSLHCGPDGVALTRYKLRKSMTDVAKDIATRRRAQFSELTSVSLAIDAGTIGGRHFLDLILMAPHAVHSPFLYDAVEQSHMTATDYGDIVADRILALRAEHNITITSIVGDNLPIQVAALAHWSPRSHLKARGGWLTTIKYQGCLCHILQLAIEECFTTIPLLCEVDRLLQEMIQVSNLPGVNRMTHSHCPLICKTRWLSRGAAATWLLRNRVVISEIDSASWQKKHRLQFQNAMTNENFESIARFHHLIHPFLQSIKFFERDATTICYVYPVFKQLTQFIGGPLSDYFESNASDDYCQAIPVILDILERRKTKHLDIGLIKFAYYMTSFGRNQFLHCPEDVTAGFTIKLTYSSLDSIPVIAAPRQSADEQSPDDTDRLETQGIPGSHPEGDFTFQGDTMEFDDVPEPDPANASNASILDFLEHFLCSLLAEDADGSVTSTPSDTQIPLVHRFIRFFFCTDVCDRFCCPQHIDPAIDQQVQMWRRIALDDPERPFIDLIRRIITVITIPASEASAERELSRQKRILTHQRERSSHDLLMARFWIMSKESDESPIAKVWRQFSLE
jgi:hypothetical protein